MKGRCVTVIIEGIYIRCVYGNPDDIYDLVIGGRVKVEPVNPLKKKNRGRKGILTGKHKDPHERYAPGKLQVETDDGRYFYSDINDLVPDSDSR